MSETIAAPRRRPIAPEGPVAPVTSGGVPVSARVWVAVGILLVLGSFALVRWAGTRPGYDPYGWLNWGYQTLRLNLDLGGAPSWKPLTYLFTVPYSIVGHYALWLWMTTATAISLSGSIFGGRIAYRLTATPTGPRWPAVAAAVFAGAAVLGIENYFHLILSSQSDPMIVSLCLAAVDAHLSGHRRWAFALAILAGLGRPETWFIAFPYSIWLWRTEPRTRWLLVAGWVLTVFVWFGIPTITNGRPLLAGDLAEGSPRMLHEGKILGTFHRFTELTYLPLQLAALGLTFVAIVRRNRTVLLLAACVVTWFVVEEAFVLHGWPGVPRYMFEPAGLMSVMAGVAVGWLLRDGRWLAPRVRELPRWLGIALSVVIAGFLVPDAIARMRAEHKDLHHERARTAEINHLGIAINRLGGPAHVRACGDPTSDVEYVSILAYYEHMNDGDVGHRPQFAIKVGHPLVLFTPLYNGWAVQTYNEPAARKAACANLNAYWIYTQPHPNGVLVPR